MQNNTMNEAEFCRKNGLKVGDVLEGVECGKVDTVRITAIGETLVLCVWNEKGEASTTFSCRDWQKVENNQVPERTNMRKITDHIVNPCNDKLLIQVADLPGAGGASHRYEISGFDMKTNDSAFPQEMPWVGTTILFQNGPIPEKGTNGVTQEALLAIVADRLRSFQTGIYACRENAIALTKIEEAMHWLHQRTIARMRRGVEGTHTV